MNENDTDLRISVARIEGMLTATLARHDQRLDQHEGTLMQHGGRLEEKGRTLARHDERLSDLEEDSSGRWGRTTGILAIIIAAAGVLFNVLPTA